MLNWKEVYQGKIGTVYKIYISAESGIPVTLEALALDARERRSTDIEGSGTVDQCADGTHTCDANAVCTDKTGGFDCACVSGYYGDGETCTRE